MLEMVELEVMELEVMELEMVELERKLKKTLPRSLLAHLVPSWRNSCSCPRTVNSVPRTLTVAKELPSARLAKKIRMLTPARPHARVSLSHHFKLQTPTGHWM